MLLELLVLALLAAALMSPILMRAAAAKRRRLGRARARARRRAERRELLRSCVNEEEWEMYRDLGFIRVHGRLLVEGPDGLLPRRRRWRDAEATSSTRDPASAREPQASAYAYLIYPHKPIVAFVPSTGRLLSEYCVEFPDLAGAISDSRLPDSDDVLAKWMALTGDERRLIADANMHLPGRQVDPNRVRRDLWRLREWERLRRASGTHAR